jgi:hypothetical protein
MRLKNTAFVHNVTVNGSSNCDWGTDIGQSAKHTFTLEGFPEFVNAMLYYKIEDTERIMVKLGKGNRTLRPVTDYQDTSLVLASLFPKVYVNGRHLAGQSFVAFILKETNELNSNGAVNVHKNRCTLKFSNSLTYRGETVNQNCIDAITRAFGLDPDGSWAILEMEIKNEDELHFKGFALGNGPKIYDSVASRNDDFQFNMDRISPLPAVKGELHLAEKPNMYDQEWSYISAIRTKPFMILGGFSGTGKSQEVKSLAFATCPNDGFLNKSETSPGNYLLLSVKPNWHDATDIIGFASSVNRNYYVTDFMRFLIKAKMYESRKVPFFVCLDEMNLAPVEEYFADFLSVIESRKRQENGTIVTDPLVLPGVFDSKRYDPDFNIFMSLGLKLTNESWKAQSLFELSSEDESEAFERADIVSELKEYGLTIPSNVIIIGTVNMDDTTNSFSRKVIDRAMTFETLIRPFTDDYFNSKATLAYSKNPLPGELFISDEVQTNEMIAGNRYELNDDEREQIITFINDVNSDLDGSPFKISFRIINETVLLYRSRKEINRLMDGNNDYDLELSEDLSDVFDDILMQKVLPRIEGDYEKCGHCLDMLKTRSEDKEWLKSAVKIKFMIARFGRDKSGFTSFWS